MNTKVLGGAVLLMLLFVFGFAAYQFVGKNSAQGAAAAASEPPIRIGLIAPITGPFPDWGESIRNGVMLATEDTHHKIDVAFQDDACDPKQTLSVAKKFASVDGIHIIFAGCDDGIKAALPFTKQHDVLVLSASLLGDAVFKENPTGLINLATQISTEAGFMAAHLHSQGIKRFAIVYATNVFGTELSERLPEKLEKYGITLVANEPTALGLSDFRTTIQKVLASKPDGIFILQAFEQVGIFAKQVRDVNKTIPLYDIYTAESKTVVEAGGRAVNGMQYTFPVNDADGREKKANFERRYKEKFGVDPSPTSYFMYDGIQLLDKALDVCASTDALCVEKFLKNYGPYEGIGGRMEIQKDGSNIRPFGIKEIRDGQFVWVTKEVKL